MKPLRGTGNSFGEKVACRGMCGENVVCNHPQGGCTFNDHICVTCSTRGQRIEKTHESIFKKGVVPP